MVPTVCLADMRVAIYSEDKAVASNPLPYTEHTNCGIQQIGVGVADLRSAFRWYREAFGMDIPVFEDEGEASLMLRYTGGASVRRHALLALNLQGGGGLEIWQYLSRAPRPAPFSIELGDLGIFAVRIKSRYLQASHAFLRRSGTRLITEVQPSPDGKPHFFAADPDGNLFDVVPGTDWFGRPKHPSGGVAGCLLGVRNMEASLAFYAEVLGYDQVVYDETGEFPDLRLLPGGQHTLRRVLLVHRQRGSGPLSRLLGTNHLELVQVHDRSPRKIFADRLWGDLGFIHVCFDVTGLAALKTRCEQQRHAFTADSGDSFDMGQAAGRFSYIEDPDGTLIEFVETHRVPIMRKLGWFLDLRKRPAHKPLPDWLLKALSFSRVSADQA